MSEYPSFVQPLPSGVEGAEEASGQLPPEVERELHQQLADFDRARAEAMAHAHEVVIWR